MMTLLSRRAMIWAVVSGAALVGFVLWSTGMVTKGIAMRDRLWRAAVSEKVDKVRNKNFKIISDLDSDRTLAEQEAAINRKWANPTGE